MTMKNEKEIRRKIEIDLYIIVIATFIVMGIYIAFQNQFRAFSNNKSMIALKQL